MDPIYILHPHLVTHTFEHLNIALVNDVNPKCRIVEF